MPTLVETRPDDMVLSMDMLMSNAPVPCLARNHQRWGNTGDAAWAVWLGPMSCCDRLSRPVIAVCNDCLHAITDPNRTLRHTGTTRWPGCGARSVGELSRLRRILPLEKVRTLEF